MAKFIDNMITECRGNENSKYGDYHSMAFK